MTRDYKRVRKACREMKKRFGELMSQIESVVENRCQGGRTQFDRLVQKSRKQSAEKGD